MARVFIDFDGTIVEDQFPDIGPLREGAKEAIEEISSEHEVFIFTARLDPNLTGKARAQKVLIQKFLDENSIPYEDILMKPHADFYIDDKAIDCKKESWNDIKNKIQSANL